MGDGRQYTRSPSSNSIVSSCYVYLLGAHEVVRIWVSGKLVGELTCGPSDGEKLAHQLGCVSVAEAEVVVPVIAEAEAEAEAEVL